MRDGRLRWMSASVVVALAAMSNIGSAQTQDAPALDTPERTLSTIDWNAANRDARRTGVQPVEPGGATGLLQFSAEQLSRASNLKIPLLMPKTLLEASRRNQLDAPLGLISQENDYTAEANAAPRNYVITGTRVVFEVEGGVAPDDKPADVYVERAEYGVEASFERYGALYSITIYCADPVNDPECADESRVRALAAEMTLATQTQ